MVRRLISSIILANIIILALLVPTTMSATLPEEPNWWNDDWNFREEIIPPIDTGIKHARYQPVDICLKFDKPCWAKNEEEHSVRVIFQNEEGFILLESQIYDLNHTDDEHIDSCCLVFLIPVEANGREKYFVYYDDEKKSSPKYPNHVDIEESYYRYERIPGFLFESSFFKIVEDGYIVYAVNKEGKAFEETMSQQVAKLKKETEDVRPNSGELGISFNLVYWYKNGKWNSISSSECLIKHQRIVDGNLMVKIAIVSESADGLLRSTVIYRYYYCPTEDKRIHVQVKHEVIRYPLPLGDEIDVSYLVLVCGGVKSSSIEELNFGRIPCYLHFYSDEERIVPFDLDQYPEEYWQNMINIKDDFDLGSFPWLSVDDGSSGKAHGIIFESNNILKSGIDERDGMQLQLGESRYIQLPGLDARSAFLSICRNSYEEGEEPDEELPEDYVVEFNAEFFTTENGGYPAVEEEAKIYQKLIQYQPNHNDNVIHDGKETERFNLITYVHLTPSFPLGSLLSTVLGLNVSYITAELYNENGFTRSGTVSCLPIFNHIPADFLRMKLVEKMKIIRRLFDWKNLSLVKRIRFPDLETGRYLIKIFRENPISKKERQFIGFAIINLEKDETTRIYCKPEGKICFSVLNQDKTGVENAEIYLKKDDVIIAESESNSNGDAIIKAPSGFRGTYTLDIIYKGFLINKEQIRLSRITKLIPLKKRFNLNVYDLEIDIKDYKRNVPTFDVDFSLTSNEMQDPITLNADSEPKGIYKFNDLYPANYTMTINYNQFEIKEKIRIPNNDSMEINLYDFTAYIKDIWNLSPGATLDVSLKSKDFEKTVVLSGERLSAEKFHFSNIYPGNYILKTRYKRYTIEEFINIPSRKNIMTIFPAVFNVTSTVFDLNGNPLKDVKVLMIRGEKGNEKEAQGFTNDNGEVTFSLPPGSYACKIYSDNNLIAERKVEVLNEKKYTIVTTDEPLLPSVIVGLAMIVLVGVAVVSYRRKDKVFFLKILVISLVVLAIFSPWWTLNGSSNTSHLETSTKLFFIPTRMVTISSNNNITVGELSSFEGNFKKEINLLFTTVVFEFLFVMDLLSTIIIIGLICLIASLILSRYPRRRLPFVVSLLAIILFVGSIVVFSYAMSQLANGIVGSFIGNGNLDVIIPWEDLRVAMSCNWGPGLGFYLILISTIISILLNLENFKEISRYFTRKKAV